MWSREFEAIKAIITKYRVDLNGPVLEVGGGPIVVVDNRPQENPLLALVPHVSFLDLGFISNYAKPHLTADFCNPTCMDSIGPYNAIFSFQTIEHATEPFIFAANMVNVVKQGGWIFLTTVFSFPYHPSPGDFWRFSPAGLWLLFKNTQANVIWTGWGPDKGGVILIAQKNPSQFPAMELRHKNIEAFDDFIKR